MPFRLALALTLVTSLAWAQAPKPGHLGVGVAELPPEAHGQGAWVRIVQPGSPAARAGLRPRDVIIGVNDQTLASAAALGALLAETPPGGTLILQILRATGGKVQHLALTARLSPPPPKQDQPP
jgi:S1-C subfamily serine protease